MFYPNFQPPDPSDHSLIESPALITLLDPIKRLPVPEGPEFSSVKPFTAINLTVRSLTKAPPFKMVTLITLPPTFTDTEYAMLGICIQPAEIFALARPSGSHLVTQLLADTSGDAV